MKRTDRFIYNYNGKEIVFTKQSEVFDFIWNTRDHVSEISGERLPNKGSWQWHWVFGHILSKGSYPKWKLNPDNIMLMLPSEHENQEQYPEFIAKREELKTEYYKQFYKK